MSERAERIGATLEVMSKPGRGATIVLTLAAPSQPTRDARHTAVAHALQ